jgi:hypothetical protein
MGPQREERPLRHDMTKKSGASRDPSNRAADASVHQDLDTPWRRVVGRRLFLRGVVGSRRPLPAGAARCADLWQQYNELGGVSGGNSAYYAFENAVLGLPFMPRVTVRRRRDGIPRRVARRGVTHSRRPGYGHVVEHAQAN